MRAKAAPLRFVAWIVAFWIGGRILALMPYGAAMPVASEMHRTPAPLAAAHVPERPVAVAVVATPGIVGFVSPHAVADRAVADREAVVLAAPIAPVADDVPVAQAGPIREVRFDLPPAPPARVGVSGPSLSPFHAAPPPVPAPVSRWAGDAYLFIRGESGRSALAAGGQLGASQVAARIAYALNDDGPPRLALVARAYAALDTMGEDGGERISEGALGIDWYPLPRARVRLTFERRVDIGGEGCNAWSAYAVAGFYRSDLPGGIEADSYGQAGIVGASRRDLFIDGALRIARPIAIDEHHMLRLGMAAWGAAQPEAARLDVGPRLALGLPVGKGVMTAALDYRIRIAGGAGPGSGPAFTLSNDF